MGVHRFQRNRTNDEDKGLKPYRHGLQPYHHVWADSRALVMLPNNIEINSQLCDIAIARSLCRCPWTIIIYVCMDSIVTHYIDFAMIFRLLYCFFLLQCRCQLFQCFFIMLSNVPSGQEEQLQPIVWRATNYSQKYYNYKSNQIKYSYRLYHVT